MDIQFEKKTRGDRRHQPRYKLSGKCIGKVKLRAKPLGWYCRSYKAFLIDFSRNGLKVSTPKKLNINDKVTITFGNGTTLLGLVKNSKKQNVEGKPHFIYGLYLYDTVSISLFRWLGVDNIECSTVVEGRPCHCQKICQYGLDTNTLT